METSTYSFLEQHTNSQNPPSPPDPPRPPDVTSPVSYVRLGLSRTSLHGITATSWSSWSVGPQRDRFKVEFKVEFP